MSNTKKVVITHFNKKIWGKINHIIIDAQDLSKYNNIFYENIKIEVCEIPSKLWHDLHFKTNTPFEEVVKEIRLKKVDTYVVVGESKIKESLFKIFKVEEYISDLTKTKNGSWREAYEVEVLQECFGKQIKQSKKKVRTIG